MSKNDEKKDLEQLKDGSIVPVQTEPNAIAFKRGPTVGNPAGYHAHSLAELNRASIASLKAIAPLKAAVPVLVPATNAAPAPATGAPPAPATPVAPVTPAVPPAPAPAAPAAWGAPPTK